MIKACDDCMHKGVCKFEESYHSILYFLATNFKDGCECQEIFNVNLECSKKHTIPINYRGTYDTDYFIENMTYSIKAKTGFSCDTLSTYPED